MGWSQGWLAPRVINIAINNRTNAILEIGGPYVIVLDESDRLKIGVENVTEIV
jgi:hypothetical protein